MLSASMGARLALGRGDQVGVGHDVTGVSTELHLASRRGDLKKVKELVEEKKFDPLQKEGQFGKKCSSLLSLLWTAWSAEIFHRKDNQAFTPLHYAASGKHLDIVRYLIAEQQVDPLCCTDTGSTPLHLASVGGDINVVRYLVNELSKFLPLKDIVTSRDKDGAAPIHIAAGSGNLRTGYAHAQAGSRAQYT